jgi:hypothetical protein
MKGRHLRQYAGDARDALKAGQLTFTTGMTLTRAGMARPDRALRGLDQIIKTVEQVGWRHVDTSQVLTRIEVHFVRA